MKKIASFAVSLSLIFSSIAQEAEKEASVSPAVVSASAQDAEKQEPAKEASVSPAVVHEDVQKKASINTPAAQVQAHTSTAESLTPSSANESKFDVMTFASQNTESIILAGGVLVYLLFVWFLNLASGVPAVAMSTTKWLYYIIGFPVVLTFLMFRLLKGMLGSSHSRNLSKFLQEGHTSTEGYSSGNHESLSREKSNQGQNSSSSSVRQQSARSESKEPDGERIVVQVNLSDRWYNRVTMAKESSSGQISRKLQEVAHNERNKTDFKGRVRAIGEQSNRVYDIIS